MLYIIEINFCIAELIYRCDRSLAYGPILRTSIMFNILVNPTIEIILKVCSALSSNPLTSNNSCAPIWVIAITKFGRIVVLYAFSLKNHKGKQDSSWSLVWIY